MLTSGLIIDNCLIRGTFVLGVNTMLENLLGKFLWYYNPILLIFCHTQAIISIYLETYNYIICLLSKITSKPSNIGVIFVP